MGPHICQYTSIDSHPFIDDDSCRLVCQFGHTAAVPLAATGGLEPSTLLCVCFSGCFLWGSCDVTSCCAWLAASWSSQLKFTSSSSSPSISFIGESRRTRQRAKTHKPRLSNLVFRLKVMVDARWHKVKKQTFQFKRKKKMWRKNNQTASAVFFFHFSIYFSIKYQPKFGNNDPRAKLRLASLKVFGWVHFHLRVSLWRFLLLFVLKLNTSLKNNLEKSQSLSLVPWTRGHAHLAFSPPPMMLYCFEKTDKNSLKNMFGFLFFFFFFLKLCFSREKLLPDSTNPAGCFSVCLFFSVIYSIIKINKSQFEWNLQRVPVGRSDGDVSQVSGLGLFFSSEQQSFL